MCLGCFPPKAARLLPRAAVTHTWSYVWLRPTDFRATRSGTMTRHEYLETTTRLQIALASGAGSRGHLGGNTNVTSGIVSGGRSSGLSDTILEVDLTRFETDRVSAWIQVIPLPSGRWRLQGSSVGNRVYDLLKLERQKRGLPNIYWSDEMARLARSQAEYCAKVGRLVHSNRFAYRGGECLWGGRGDLDPMDAIQAWLRSKAGHREYVLSPRTRKAGIGISRHGGFTCVAFAFSDEAPTYPDCPYYKNRATVPLRRGAKRRVTTQPTSLRGGVERGVTTQLAHRLDDLYFLMLRIWHVLCSSRGHRS